MKVVSVLRRAARERILYPIAGRVVDRFLQWCRHDDAWERMAWALAHSMIDHHSAAGARAAIAEMIERLGPYVKQESIDMLWLIDEIAQKHSPEAD